MVKPLAIVVYQRSVTEMLHFIKKESEAYSFFLTNHVIKTLELFKTTEQLHRNKTYGLGEKMA